MRVIWRDDLELPPGWKRLKEEHYRAVFGEAGRWEEMHRLSVPSPGEELLTVEDEGRIAGKCFALRKGDILKIRDFAVHPDARGKGIAGTMMAELEKRAAEMGPLDYIVSYPYLLAADDGERRETERFGMGQFFLKHGFRATDFGDDELNGEEKAGVRCYGMLGYPRVRLRLFRKRLTPVTLPPEIKAELSSLSERERGIVLSGLDAKLSAYGRKGAISYRYDVCPVCRDAGSTLEEPRCGRCYIPLSCKEPFMKGFRYDDVAGGEYFRKMREFLSDVGGGR